MSIRTKRVYEEPSPDDGERILVDRLWPRGLTKEKAAVDEWLKELAPSDALRKWFHHEEPHWDEFRRRYRKELEAQRDAVAALARRAKRKRITLLFGAKDEERNNATALAEVLSEKC